MSFPRYPAYRDSGVEWLGEVPAHWEVVPIKRLFRIVSGSTPRSDDEALWNGDVLWATPADLSQPNSLYLADTQRKITQLGLESCAATLVPASSLLLSTRAPIGSLAIADVPMATNQGCKALIPGSLANTQYFARVLSICTEELNVRGKGSTFLELSGDELGAFLVPMPSPDEQADIASFLERETARLDALMAEQQRLIALLKEKRQAVMSHAVTKGLDPHAPMKHSGVEWLGEVPAHWEVQRLRFLCDIQTGSRDTEEAVPDGEFPFFVRSQSVERIDSAAFDCEAILTAGDGAGVGKVFHYHTGPFDFHQRVYMLNRFRGISGRFLFHFLRENFYKVALEGGAKSTVDSLRRPMFLNFPVCLPSLDEQCKIVDAIEGDAERYGALIAEAESAIALLQERRTALISAAVTGKIDVRRMAEAAA